ncbi:hypothetical protein GIB67_028921, partial [Kingdonia uniflora]
MPLPVSFIIVCMKNFFILSIMTNISWCGNLVIISSKVAGLLRKRCSFCWQSGW